MSQQQARLMAVLAYRSRPDHEPATPAGAARVAFVGTGPGPVELLTLGASQSIAEADGFIVAAPLWQRLAEAGIVPVQEPSDQAGEPADDGISAAQDFADGDFAGALAQLQDQGARRIVRLLPGDPVADHDLGAELAVCSQAGIAETEVVPGISLTSGVAGLAGVQLKPGQGLSSVWLTRPDQLAGYPDGLPGAAALQRADLVHGIAGDSTQHIDDPGAQFEVPGSGSVIVRCTVAEVPALVAAALASGRHTSDSVLLTSAPGNNQQHTLRTTLSKLNTASQQLAAGQPGGSDEPVQITLGQAADRDPALDWFEGRALAGWQLLMPRTRKPPSQMLRRVQFHGASMEQVPTMQVEPPRNPQPMERAVHGIVDGRYGWVIFTSENAVAAVMDKMVSYGLDARAFSGVRLAAVNKAAVQALEAWGITPDLVPAGELTCQGLVAEFPAYDDLLDPIDRVLVPRADIATEVLNEGLISLGWQVEDVTAYRTVRAAPPPASIREAIKTGYYDAVLFTSSSTVRNLVGIAGKPHQLTVVAAIGPAAAAACEEHGLRVDVLAPVPDPAVLVDALAQFALQRAAALRQAGSPVLRPSQKRRRRTKSEG